MEFKNFSKTYLLKYISLVLGTNLILTTQYTNIVTRKSNKRYRKLHNCNKMKEAQ